MTVKIEEKLKKRGRPTKSDAKEKITMLMHPVLRERLQALAHSCDMPYQTLAHQILADEVATQTAYLNGSPLHKLAFVAHGLKKLAKQACEEMDNVSEEDQARLAEAFGCLMEAAEGFRQAFGSDEDDEEED